MAKQLPPPYGTAAAAVEQQTQVVKGGIAAYKSGDISPLLVSVVPKQAQPAAKVLAQAVSKRLRPALSLLSMLRVRLFQLFLVLGLAP